MHGTVRTAVVAVLVVANLAWVASRSALPLRAPAEPAQVRTLAAGEIDAGFVYGPSVTAADRADVEAAIAAARPEAQRLIALVDGLTTIDVGGADPGAAGTAQQVGERYLVSLDLSLVRRLGPRGIARLVLHELGHVVDFALVSDTQLAAFDAGIPEGWVCEEGRVGSCAASEERFAETFAKWATGDIGVDLYIGYKVPPPAMPLDTWGAPLLTLGA